MKLPQWLDSIIYDKYGAVFEPRPLDVVYNPDQSYDFVKLYLGTYFPRSFAEACYIVVKLFMNPEYKNSLQRIEEINLLDFGCGTGGEIFGMILVLQSQLPNLKRINVDAVDANPDAIRILYHLVRELDKVDIIKIQIHITPRCLFIETDQDLEDMINCLNVKYHYILSFKALNEFVQKGTFFGENVYSKIVSRFLPLLSSCGILVLSDVTTKLNDRYLFYPELMNTGINEVLRENIAYKSIVPHACYYMENECRGCYMQDIFRVSHSRKVLDRTKIAYRILCHANFADSVMINIKPNSCKAINPYADKFAPYR